MQAIRPFIRPHENGVYLAIKLQPRAASNEIADFAGNELRIRVTAPPVDSAANDALLRFLADQLGCPRSALQLTRGHTSRHKMVLVSGVTVQQIAKALSPTQG